MATCECGCGVETKPAAKTLLSRGVIKGQPLRFIHGHHTRMIVRPKKDEVVRYRFVKDESGKTRTLHRVRAEKALGRPLPIGAVVHHADGSTSDMAPLVICPGESYHKLLHRRMRVLAAGGNPNTDKCCTRCKAPKPYECFARNNTTRTGCHNECKACQRDRASQRRMGGVH